ncbi:hypothetical protein BO86DRAFT_394562 [Aspergillus japonicus CBS 114.51]|uniref:Uncharacterized protein n=1 Tax=Aspergillus japonicus CBS 114.51 TaxID=1448312 RepID=A0A8T8XG34_ASPJA|nr:hypothetical protein BO86DRAFT_394562 [Aspergillus japonicus CBS 114.51]RAH86764.1 hypothetical protein BO86DRAFT_394562 [Aspergillus japonicus CBS 114.51]
MPLGPRELTKENIGLILEIMVGASLCVALLIIASLWAKWRYDPAPYSTNVRARPKNLAEAWALRHAALDNLPPPPLPLALLPPPQQQEQQEQQQQ